MISWMFIAMMGADGLTEATKVAILSANFIRRTARLSRYFRVLYRGRSGRVAHECILGLREWKQRAEIEVEDVAKRHDGLRIPRPHHELAGARHAYDRTHCRASPRRNSIASAMP